MSIYEQYFAHLGSLENGVAVQRACTDYKRGQVELAGHNFDVFELNGLLRGKTALSDHHAKFTQLLTQAICARNTQPLTLYRMTTIPDLSAPIIPVLESAKFRYEAFMSTSGKRERLSNFIYEMAVLLEIACPRYTTMALVESGNEGDVSEDEYLLGAATTFRIDEVSSVEKEEWELCGGDFDEELPTPRVKLSVIESPSYTQGYEFFDF